jgi:hypothetical protein
MSDKFWPNKKPKYEQELTHGWLGHGNKDGLIRVMDDPNIHLICELGTWYGKSAEFIMNYINDKGLICVDLWSNNDIKEGNQVIKYNDNVLVKHWKDKRTKDKEQAKIEKNIKR